MTATLLVVLLAGCSVSTLSPPDATQAGAPPITSPEEAAREIDQYLPSLSLALRLIAAEESAISECLAGKGATERYREVAVGAELSELLAFGIRNRVERSALWGYFVSDSDSVRGYHGGEGGTASLSVQEPPGVTHDQVESCQLEASQEFDGGGLPAIFMVEPASLLDRGPAVPSADPRIKSVMTGWSDCMSREGFDYATPVAAFQDPQWLTTNGAASPQEIAVASADLSCKRETNLVGISLTVQREVDDAYIYEHQALLDQHIAALHAFVDAHA